jgi:hypothetical protein
MIFGHAIQMWTRDAVENPSKKITAEIAESAARQSSNPKIYPRISTKERNQSSFFQEQISEYSCRFVGKKPLLKKQKDTGLLCREKNWN